MTPSPFIGTLKKYMPIAEIGALAGAVLGYLLMQQNYPVGTDILKLSLGALAAIYFLSAYMPPDARPENENEQNGGFLTLLGRTIAPKVLGIGSAVTVIGILFALQQLKGSNEMLLVGSGTLAIACLIGFASMTTDETARKTLAPQLLRAVPLLLVGVYLLSKAPSIA